MRQLRVRGTCPLLLIGPTLPPEFRLTLFSDCSTMTSSHTLRSDDPMAVELTAALEHGDVERLRRPRAAHSQLASRVNEKAKGAGRTALHPFSASAASKPHSDALIATLVVSRAELQ